jgi:hypothetical protein
MADRINATPSGVADRLPCDEGRVRRWESGEVRWSSPPYRRQVQLDEDTLDRRRRVLGDGHLGTMASASFALILSGLAADPEARAAMETLKAAWPEHGEGRQPGS